MQTVTNLCSAFSYCLTILDTLYVWYGCGSTPAERKAALLYGQALGNGASVVELTEGENDDDEMFWMILGSDEYAKAHYWRWRATAGQPESRIWRVDAKGKPPVSYTVLRPCASLILSMTGGISAIIARQCHIQYCSSCH